MIIVLAQATARPEHRDALAEELAKASVTSRNDPGCLDYSFQSNVEDPNAFTSIERWETGRTSTRTWPLPTLPNSSARCRAR